MSVFVLLLHILVVLHIIVLLHILQRFVFWTQLPSPRLGFGGQLLGLILGTKFFLCALRRKWSKPGVGHDPPPPGSRSSITAYILYNGFHLFLTTL